VFGAWQLEAGAFATSYIPTTTAAATRAADVAVMTGANFSNWYSQSEGTLYAEYSRLATSTANSGMFAFSVNDGGANNIISLSNNFGGTSDRFVVLASASAQAVISVGTATTAFVKKAGTYKVNSFQLSKNGTLGTEDTSGIVPVVDRAGIGCYGNGVEPLNGTIKKLAYFPRRLSDAELTSITS
jgi:hypothetical protein